MTVDIPQWKKYYLKHKDKIHESNKKWRNKNKKKLSEYTRKYLQAHPEKKNCNIIENKLKKEK